MESGILAGKRITLQIRFPETIKESRIFSVPIHPVKDTRNRLGKNFRTNLKTHKHSFFFKFITVNIKSGGNYLCSPAKGYDVVTLDKYYGEAVDFFTSLYAAIFANRRDVNFCKYGEWTLEPNGSGKFYIRNSHGEYLYDSNYKNNWELLYTWLGSSNKPDEWGTWEIIESNSAGWYYIATRSSGKLRYLSGENVPWISGSSSRQSFQILDATEK